MPMLSSSRTGGPPGAGLSDVLTFAAQARPASLAEPGCLGYEVLQDTTDANHLVLVEHYRDEVALEDHLNSPPHYQELVVGEYPSVADRQDS